MSRSSSIAMSQLTALAMGVTMLLFGLITGFFYAYSSSVMFGFDVIDPRHAISAMQGINREVKNLVFAPAFFGTPVAAVITAIILFVCRKRKASMAFVAAAAVYILGAMVPTFTINVPMNDALGALVVPTDIEAARGIWQDYSVRWSFWNGFRTIGSGVALLLAAGGIYFAGYASGFNSAAQAGKAGA